MIERHHHCTCCSLAQHTLQQGWRHGHLQACRLRRSSCRSGPKKGTTLRAGHHMASSRCQFCSTLAGTMMRWGLPLLLGWSRRAPAHRLHALILPASKGAGMCTCQMHLTGPWLPYYTHADSS